MGTNEYERRRRALGAVLRFKRFNSAQVNVSLQPRGYRENGLNQLN
jgi:hypothetical protein